MSKAKMHEAIGGDVVDDSNIHHVGPVFPEQGSSDNWRGVQALAF